MDNELRFDEPLPESVLATARELYAPPAADAYWASLETRIMTAVANEQRHTTHSWSRTALAAAAAILLAFGALVMRSHADQIRAAFNSLSKPAPAESLSVPDGALGAGDAQPGTLKDAIRR